MNNHSTKDHYQRTNEVHQLIKEKFDKLVQKKESGYLFTGQSSYGFHFHGIRISSDEVIESKIKSSSKKINILDVGSGNAAFSTSNNNKYPDKIVSYDISAKDFRTPPSNTQSNYLIANAEYLTQAYPKVEFDLIFSRATFMHFTDVVGALMEAYKKLKPGGLLLIDEFSIPGCNEYIDDVIPYLRAQGYTVISNTALPNKLTDFIIQKTAEKPELLFPVIISKITNDDPKDPIITYKPSESLKKFYDTTPNEDIRTYENGKELVDKLLSQDLSIKSKMGKWNSLPDLFASDIYREANAQLQYKLLLHVVSKLIDFDFYLHLYEVVKKFKYDQNPMFTFFFTRIDLFKREYFSNKTFQLLPGFEEANDYDRQAMRLILIIFTVVKNIIEFGRSAETELILKKLETPYKVDRSVSGENKFLCPDIDSDKIQELLFALIKGDYNGNDFEKFLLNDKINFLLKSGISSDPSQLALNALIFSAQLDHDKMVDLLMSTWKIPMNSKNIDGQTVLHAACQSSSFSTVKFLLERGVDVNIFDNDKSTPLHKAVSYGRVKTVEFLLRKMANPTLKNNSGETPLMIAKQMSEEDPENERMTRIVNLLESSMRRLDKNSVFSAPVNETPELNIDPKNNKKFDV